MTSKLKTALDFGKLRVWSVNHHRLWTGKNDGESAALKDTRALSAEEKKDSESTRVCKLVDIQNEHARLKPIHDAFEKLYEAAKAIDPETGCGRCLVIQEAISELERLVGEGSK